MPDEIVEQIIMAPYGRAQLHHPDYCYDWDRRRFYRVLTLVSRQFHRIAQPLLCDSVIIGTLEQAKALEANPGALRSARVLSIEVDEHVRRDIDDFDDPEMWLQWSWTEAPQLEDQARSIARRLVSQCSNLQELRGGAWRDLHDTDPDSPLNNLPESCFSLVIGQLELSDWLDGARSFLERAGSITAFMTATSYFRYDHDRISLGPRAAKRISRLTVNVNGLDLHPFAGHLLRNPAAALKHLRLSFSRGCFLSGDPREPARLFSRCPGLVELELRVTEDFALFENEDRGRGFERILMSAPSTLQRLCFDLDCSLLDFSDDPEDEYKLLSLSCAQLAPGFIAIFTELADALEDVRVAPSLYQLSFRCLRPTGQALQDDAQIAFDTLVQVASRRGLIVRLSYYDVPWYLSVEP